MKKRLFRVLMVTMGVVILILSLGIPVAAAGNGASNGGGSGTCDRSGQQNMWQQTVAVCSRHQSGDCSCIASATEVTPLSDEEISWLTYMREEEKLARDVYRYLYPEWNLRIFNNIAASEQKHMDAINTLLVRYDITDPAAGKGDGEFTNTTLQALYVKLIEDGSVSLVEALNAGVFIEETDIADLEEAIAATTHKDLETVFNNLLQGSQNHLDAFNSTLAKIG